jgi:dihydrofolate reductase
MGAIRVHEFISIDGVVEDPSWTRDFGFDPRMGDAIAAITGDAGAILLGRTTFEMFAPAWSTRTAEDDPGAPFFNDTAKYVVSGTLRDPDWSNSSVLGPYAPDQIQKLKDSVDGAIYVSGSATLVRAMLSDGLVDSLHLFQYPVVLGRGLRLFPEGTPRMTLSPSGVESYTNGVVHLAYAAG